MLAIKTVRDKTDALQRRQQQSANISSAVQRLEHQARSEPVTCGSGILCRLWRSVCGSKPGVKATPSSKLSEAATAMEARISELEKRVSEQKTEARKAMSVGNKQAALRAMKKAKQIEKQIASNQAALDAVETQVDLLAQAEMQKTVASALSKTSKGIKKDKKLLKRAEDALDGATEVRDLADDLNGVMNDFAASSGPGDVDDDDLLEELQSMMDDNNGGGGDEQHKEAQELVRRQEQWDAAEAIRQQLPVAPMDDSVSAKTRVMQGGRGSKKMESEKSKLLTAVG